MTTGAGDVVRLVGGDERPIVVLTLTDEDTGSPINVAAASTVVTVKFRQAGSTTVLSTISTDKVNGGADGVIAFSFTGGILDVPAGSYEFEIVVDFDGDIQTVYNLVRVRLRAPFS